MKLEEIMSENCVFIDEALSSKDEVLAFLSKKLFENQMILDQEPFLKKVYYRESLSETGLVQGIAIPHGISDVVVKPCVAFVRLKESVKWETIDASDVDFVFMLAIPEKCKDNLHIKMISQLARSLMKTETIEQLKQVNTAKEVLDLLKKGGEDE